VQICRSLEKKTINHTLYTTAVKDLALYSKAVIYKYQYLGFAALIAVPYLQIQYVSSFNNQAEPQAAN